LLFFENLSLCEESIERLQRRGFETEASLQICAQQNCILAPRATLRRYWNKTCWSQVYLKLLNRQDDDSNVLDQLAKVLEECIETSSCRQKEVSIYTI
jgi:hypothetical protein